MVAENLKNGQLIVLPQPAERSVSSQSCLEVRIFFGEGQVVSIDPSHILAPLQLRRQIRKLVSANREIGEVSCFLAQLHEIVGEALGESLETEGRVCRL